MKLPIVDLSDSPKDMLALIFARQRELQTNSYGADPRTLEGAAMADYVRSMAYALEDEIHEATNEVGWKPWATSRHINREAYLGELVDALHFFVNLCLVAGIEPEEVFVGYMQKAEKNRLRQARGYDGVSDKCQGCRRALDDAAVYCRPATETSRAYCVETDQFYDSEPVLPIPGFCPSCGEALVQGSVTHCRLEYSGIVWCVKAKGHFKTDDGSQVQQLIAPPSANSCPGCKRNTDDPMVACTADGCVLPAVTR